MIGKILSPTHLRTARVTGLDDTRCVAAERGALRAPPAGSPDALDVWRR